MRDFLTDLSLNIMKIYYLLVLTMKYNDKEEKHYNIKIAVI